MILSLIVAASENHVIGINNTLPWHLSEDLKRFKKLTMGSPIIMGRKTFESIGRALPGRDNIVITKNNAFNFEGIIKVNSIDEAIHKVKNSEEVFFIGGATIYEQIIDLVDRIYLTKVYSTIDGDTFFPNHWENHFKIVYQSERLNDEKSDLDYQFIDYRRIKS